MLKQSITVDVNYEIATNACNRKNMMYIYFKITCKRKWTAIKMNFYISKNFLSLSLSGGLWHFSHPPIAVLLAKQFMAKSVWQLFVYSPAFCTARGEKKKTALENYALPVTIRWWNIETRNQVSFIISPLRQTVLFWRRLVIAVLYVMQKNNTGHSTPYCLALQWHDYTFTSRCVLFLFVTVIWWELACVFLCVFVFCGFKLHGHPWTLRTASYDAILFFSPSLFLPITL